MRKLQNMRRVVAVVMLYLGALACRAEESQSITFSDDSVLKRLELTGNVSIDKDFKRDPGSAGSLKIGPGASVVVPLRKKDGAGKVEFWVYDDATAPAKPKAPGAGAMWGLQQEGPSVLTVGPMYAGYLDGAKTYTVVDYIPGKESPWQQVQWIPNQREARWSKWTFEFNDKGLTILRDGLDLNRFKKIFKWNNTRLQGFNGLVFKGGEGNAAQTLWIADVQVTLGAEGKKEPAGAPPPTIKPEEAIKPVPEATLAKIIKAAPALPSNVEQGLGLNLRLIDYIDCTRTDDPHDFRDQGTSRVVNGPAGTYRVTAPHHHAFFSYAYKTEGPTKPVLLVIEYPDDAKRDIVYMTHDSMRPAKPHTSFSQETGVYTGDTYPLSKKMQYFTLVAWPQDDWSPLIVANWARAGAPAAASRIWVYAMDGLPPLETANAGRTLDMFFPLLFLAQRDNFGWQHPQSIGHMVDYCGFIGVNRVTLEVFANQTSWGGNCTVPAWELDDKGQLDKILEEMDAKGGVGFMAGIMPPQLYGLDVKIGGKKLDELPDDEFKAVMLKGFEQFIDRYGKYKSFQGFVFGSMESPSFTQMLLAHGALEDVVAFIKKKRPDLEVETFIGDNHALQVSPFYGSNHRYFYRPDEKMPSTWDIIQGWEQAGGGSWSEFATRKMSENFARWKFVPTEVKKVPGLNVYEQYAPDDHRLASTYWHNPRAAMYLDTQRSPGRNPLYQTPYAAIFDFFTEGYIGQHKNVNFWYSKLWTGPSLNPGGSSALMAWALAMGQHDRLAISAGGWSVKYFGLDVPMRRFAKAYRQLPPVVMSDVATPVDTAKVRWVVYNGKRYISAVSLIPFASKLVIDGATIDLPPYELIALIDDGKTGPKVTGTPCAEYATWVEQRLAEYEKLVREVRTLNAEAAPACYDGPAKEARVLLNSGKLYDADVTLGAGLMNEMRLRRDVLEGPELKAARISAAPPLTGSLDAWPKEATDIKIDDGSAIPSHVFYPNSWFGPKDLSARLRLAHDGTTLYIGAEVHDDVLDEKDGIQFDFSKAGYADWRGQSLKMDFSWPVTLPMEAPQTTGKGAKNFTYSCRRTTTGYVVEGRVPLAGLELKPGGALGFRLQLKDGDRTPNLFKAGWALKQAMVYPHHPVGAFWEDARNCGRLTLE